MAAVWVWYLAAIGGLLLLSALFSGSETAFFSLTPAQRDRLREDDPRTGRRIDRLLRRPERILGSILLANLAVNTSASALFTLMVVGWAGATGHNPAPYLGIGGLALTGVLLVFGEVTPKVAATHGPVRFVRAAGPVVSALNVLLAPLVLVLTRVGFRLTPRRSEPEFLSEEELHTMIRVGRERGVIVEREEEILWNLVGLEERTVSEVMTPRIDMVGLESDTGVDRATEVCREAGRSRLPVYRRPANPFRSHRSPGSLPLRAPGCNVCKSGRLRQSIPFSGPKHPLCCGFHRDPVTGRNEQGLRVVLASEDDAHLPALDGQRSHRATLLLRLLELADQARLGAADRRTAQEKPHVGGETQPARVRDPLAIEHEKVRLGLELPVGEFDDRTLTEAQQAGDIRESRLSRGGNGLADLERLGVEHNDGRVEKVPLTRERDVETSDAPDFTEIVLEDEPGSQVLLDPEGVLDRDIPRVTADHRHLHLPMSRQDSVRECAVKVNRQPVYWTLLTDLCVSRQPSRDLRRTHKGDVCESPQAALATKGNP